MDEEDFKQRINELEKKFQERNKQLENKIEKLEKQKTPGSKETNSQKEASNEDISRRDFLKKAGLGLGGLAALSSPVSADYFIKDDSFSVQTSNDGGSTLTEGLFVSQNQDVNIPNGDLDLNTNNLVNVNQINGQDADAIGGSGVPSGAIIMWSGSITDIPSGWTLCDGSDGAPNLQDRFVVGAGNSYGVGGTGGSSSVSLSTSELPSHSHSVSEEGAGGFSQTVSDSDSHSHYFSDSASGSHSHSFSTSTSTNGSHKHKVGYFNIDFGGDNATGNGDFMMGTSIDGANTTESAGSHSHGVSGSTSSESVSISVSGNTNSSTVSFSDTVSVSDHTHNVSINSTGNGESHENRPPYYALAFIMKT